MIRRIQLTFTLPDEDLRYFEACARIRDIDKSAFFSILLSAIAKDQMVLGIMDDDSKSSRKPRGYRYRTFQRGEA
ncbi:MAG: hypothetical protein JWP08_1919 [Bryobacterales bacterium]|nr:hypothetical protein [Bryobacterales bacterium]